MLGRRFAQTKGVLAYQIERFRNSPNIVLNSITARLPISARTRLVYSLERSIPTLELDLNHLSPSKSQYVSTSQVVADAEGLVIPASPPIEITDGNYWNPLQVHRLRDVTVDPSTGLVFAGRQVIAQSGYGW